MDAELTRRLVEIAGAGGVVERTGVVIPRDADMVATIARACAETLTPMTVSSSASGTDGAAPPRGVVISLNRLTGISVAAGGLTLRAEAGAPVAALGRAAGDHQLAVVGFPAAVDADHVGTLIARGEVPRRSLCGIEAVLSTGERVSAGGNVLKDVVGYDLAAVLLGSMGALAIIVAATFRLEPALAGTPVSEPPGALPRHELIARAFDPQGLLSARG
jgi:FAD/FMN-containing dehydrogenase